MLRFLGIATLVLIALCLAVGASIALADEDASPDAAVEAVDPDHRMIDESLAAVAGEDIYEFDFVIGAGTEPSPEVETTSDILEIRSNQ